MNCKFCQSKMNEEELVCPACGRNQEEPLEEAAEEIREEVAAEVQEEAAPEAPIEEPVQEPEIKAGMTFTPGKIALFILGCVVLFAVVVGLVVGGMQRGAGDSEEPTTATGAVPEETVVYTVPADGNPDDATCKGTYTVTDEEVIAARETVVATIGEESLSNGQLQAYYWAGVAEFMQQYGGYASYFGLDVTQGLDVQACPLAEGYTWQQLFLENALDQWHKHKAVNLEAKAAGFVTADDFNAHMEQLPDLLEESAVSAGMTSAEELIQEVAGAACTKADYLYYLTEYNNADYYYGDCYDKINPTDEEVAAYFEENLAAFEEAGVTKDSGLAMSVRHILLQPENGVANDQGYYDYSDEDWAACEAEAQALLDQWKAGEATEESFAQLANEHSVDGGSNTIGGLYTGLNEDTNFVENFKAWYMDESRKAGDTGLVQTEHGWHIMYFSGVEELWLTTAREELVNEKASVIIPAAMENHPMTVDYSAIVLALADLF